MKQLRTNTVNPLVDEYIRQQKRWQPELQALRLILRDCKLTEEMKWRAPCYTFQGKNVALVGALKDYCALSFPKGALLKDPQKLLVAPGQNTRAVRLIKFTDAQEIVKRESVLKKYLREAIEI
ncbi:MAG: DUF1801 domain-containing protein, partial [Planctomycetales bacterium]|nr:DUF1801 domain-containing protein [Planctomycetales bacterium]